MTDLIQSNRQFNRNIWVVTVISLLNAAAFSISLPFLALYLYQERGFDMTSIGFVILLSGLGSAMTQVSSGVLSDRLGRRPLLLMTAGTSALLFGLMAFLIQGHSPVWSIITAYVAGRSIMVMGRPVIQAMVTDLSSKEHLAETYGLLRVGQNSGWAIGPAIGGYLLTTLSYSWLFLFAALICIGVFSLVLLLIKESFHGAAEPVTFQSIVQTTRDRSFFIFIAICFLVFMVSGQMITTLSVYLVDKVGFSAAQYGLVLMLNGIIVIFLQYPIARFVNNRVIGALITGSILYGIGYLAMGWVNIFGLGMAAMAIVTFGEITFTPVAQAVIGRLSHPDWRGRYMGLFGLSQTLGVSLGPIVGGLVLDNFTGNHPLIWATIAFMAFAAATLFFLWCHKSPAKKCLV